MTMNRHDPLGYFGTDIAPCVGDHVRYEGDSEDLIVEEIVVTAEGPKISGLAEAGLATRRELSSALSNGFAGGRRRMTKGVRSRRW